MKSDVLYLPQRGQHSEMAASLGELLKNIELPWAKKKSRIGIKLHWGEPGNKTFLPPDYARAVAGDILRRGAKPFIFDTTTLYRGERKNAIDSLWVAHKHGFDYGTTGAPVLVADGVSKRDTIVIPVPGNPIHQKTVKVASLVDYIDGIITLSHFKGHIASGFGGVIKNISMGFASSATKQVMHGDVKPELEPEKCDLCGTCAEFCPEGAITLSDKLPIIDLDACIGCGECIAMCPTCALRIQWNARPQAFVEKLAETAAAVCERTSGRMLHIIVLANITRECDCMPKKMEPLVPDLGVLVGADPIALDSAACDLFNGAKPFPGSGIMLGAEDKLEVLFPEIPYRRQLEYGVELGMGSVEYNLIRIGNRRE